MKRPPIMSPSRRALPSLLAIALNICFLCLPAQLSLAATTDISNYPMVSGTIAPPNIMFVLDNSGSMTWDFMPDDLDPGYQAQYSLYYGFWSSQCNGVAFNPTFVYTPPIKADGSLYPNINFKAAPLDGYNPTSGTNVDLSVITKSPTGNYGVINKGFYYQYTGKATPLSWSYGNNGLVNNTTTFYQECMSTIPTSQNPGGTPGINVFTQVNLSTQSAAIQQNYANWYSYYRTRQLMMRTSAGRAFGQLSPDTRVGFTVISDSTVSSAQFLDVTEFNPTQKSNFFTLLYSTTAGGNTPLRAALSKVGRYYGKVYPGQTYDPIKYSCQRNFALVSTDGYWNSSAESGSYIPAKLNNTTLVDQQDGNEARPMKDSATGGTGSSNALADVAEYYWITDLRPDLINNVAPLPTDTATYQHLNTYTIGLGLKGTLNYTRDYLSNPAASDYAGLISGAKNWPIPSNSEDATHIDDLWHAAVNGRGQYFSVSNSNELASALVSALDSIGEKTSTGAAAATSAQAPVQVDRWVFIANYTSKSWVGDLRAFQFTLNNGILTAPDTVNTAPVWSAAAVLDTRNLTASPRKILFNSADASKTLKDFTYANLSTAGLATAFDNRCGVPTARAATEMLSQCPQLNTASADLRANVTGDNLVNYLRGDTTYYLNSSVTSNQLFRSRDSRLGDIVNGAPIYVGRPPFKYADAGYASFVTAKADRTKMVYAPANDGMLHAFKVGADSSGVLDGTGGTELWAFVPTAVIPDLWRLADDSYKTNHRYFVDSTPVLADVYDGSQWRTILVGGLGAGGRAFYAIDVTVPETPILLWEFSSSDDANLGLAMGQAVITKNAAGTWVVALSSGINNGTLASNGSANTPAGDGIGRVYILNAVTGKQLANTPIKTCTTAVVCSGDTTTPSNLIQLNAWTVSATDNTALRYYGGDMLGNLWRFDPDNLLPPSGIDAVLLGTARSPSGAIQPITTRPVLNEIQAAGKPVALVSFSTGKLMSLPDFTDTTVQTIYTIRDTLLDKAELGLLRTSPAGASTAGLVEQPMNASRQTPQIKPVNWADSTVNGWYVDLNATANSGERVIINGVSANGVLGFATMLPSSDICQPGGTSYLYQFDMGTGAVLKAEAFSEVVTGLGVLVSTDGSTDIFATLASGKQYLSKREEPQPTYSSSIKRTSWRELVD
ncbi:MAG: pilus assembly protein [Leptothrix sp. (in: b-proteobacteria)]